MRGSSSRSASGSGSGSGSGPPYLDPHLVYELLTHLSPREVLDYLDSIPGSSRDANCNRIRAVANALRALLSQPLRLSLSEESRRIQRWAQRARSHAEDSVLCAPRIVGNPSSFTPDEGHNMHPHNSSSCSGRILTKEPGPSMLRHKSSSYSRRVLNRKPDSKVHRHTATHDPLSASSSKNAAARLPSLQANRMHRHASVHNQSSASNSRIQPAMPPLQANKKSISPRTRQKAKGRMGSSSTRCFRTPSAVSRRGGALPLREAPQPSATSPASPASGKRSGGDPQPHSAPRPAPTASSSPPPTSPPQTSLTSPRQPCCRARRPLRLCQRRILTEPSEAVTAPPRRSVRLATAYARGTLGSWSFRQTIEKERVYFSDDDSDEWEGIIKRWSDDDSDD